MTSRDVFEWLWEKYGEFHVYVRRDYPGLVMHKDYPVVSQKGMKEVMSFFRLEPNNHGNNWSDYDVDEENLYITISFAGKKMPMTIPWESIAVFTTDDFQVSMYLKDVEPVPEDAPEPKSAGPTLTVVK